MKTQFGLAAASGYKFKVRTCNFNFLDASTHLYKRVCPSVDQCVRWSVRNTFFSSMSRLCEKMVGNGWENNLKCVELIRNIHSTLFTSPNTPNLSKSLLNCPKTANPDASLSERTCFLSSRFLIVFNLLLVFMFQHYL